MGVVEELKTCGAVKKMRKVYNVNLGLVCQGQYERNVKG